MPPVLSDGVVRLRPWTADDAPALVSAWHDDEIAGRLTVPDDRSPEAATRWIEGWEDRRLRGLALDLVICEPPDDDVRGEVGLSHIDPTREAALIGWWVAEASRGRRLATRAVRLVARWALGSNWLSTLVAEIDTDNVPSLRLAASCGFVPLERSTTDRRVHVLTGPPPGRFPQQM